MIPLLMVLSGYIGDAPISADKHAEYKIRTLKWGYTVESWNIGSEWGVTMLPGWGESKPKPIIGVSRGAINGE